ncbi:YceI family protein [Actinacidiphila sp. bgisy167]|uniref:YceI family protein n=1 Tax=Actinacidiphila sp. bgisy167 TaxID=3413797 RepID=UPI003D712D1F
MPGNCARYALHGSRPPLADLSGAYVFDPVDSAVGFSFRHAAGPDVRGGFRDFEGFLRIDARRPGRSEAHVSVQSGSLDTGLAARDARIAGPRFLDSAAFPLMVFRSTAVAPSGADRFRVTGPVRIKDVELPLRLDLGYLGVAHDAGGRRRIGFEGSATIRRRDWGLAGSVPPAVRGIPPGDEIRLELRLCALRLGPEAR